VRGVSTIAARFEVAEVNGHDVELKGAVTGLTPGTYVLHYHAPTGCDPMAGDPQDKHLGDLGTIHPDPSGAATVTFTIKDARLGGMHPITDTCLAIYAADGVTVLSYGHIFGRALGIGH
jgi:Cu/Zn superoxide dismutase